MPPALVVRLVLEPRDVEEVTLAGVLVPTVAPLTKVKTVPPALVVRLVPEPSEVDEVVVTGTLVPIVAPLESV